MTRLLFLLLSACRPPPPTVGAGDAPDGHLVVAHTNDVHSHFEPAPADWLDGRPAIGGYVAIKAHLDAMRLAQGDDAVIYLDAGDILTGTPLMEFQVHGAYGGAMLDFMHAAGCLAWTLGNHEFDRGFTNAAELVDASPMPVLAANLRSTTDASEPAFDNLRERLILDRNGVRVGIFGLTTPTLGRLASKDTMARIAVEDVVEVARREVANLEPRVDLVVALTHLGVDVDRELARQVDGIDLIVGGHSHTRLEKPIQVGDTWIVQTAGEGRQLGVVEFDVTSDGRLSHLSAENVDLLPDRLPLPPDPRMQALVEKWDKRIERRFRVVVGQMEGSLDREGGEHSAGRWAADLVRSAGGADVGIYNGSGVRADLAGGEVTLGALYQVFPFSNQVVSFEATGDEIMRLVLTTIHAETSGKRAPLQWSGVTFTWRLRMDTPEVLEVRVGGNPLDLARTYRVATNSYVAEQWEYNLGFEPRNLEGHAITVLEAAEAALRQGRVVAPMDPRSIHLKD